MVIFFLALNFFPSPKDFDIFDKSKLRENPQKPATFVGLTGDLSTLTPNPLNPQGSLPDLKRLHAYGFSNS